MGQAVTRQEAFWEACGFGNTERVRKFIQEGIDVNWISYTHNSCAIHVASQGKADIVQMLLDGGCNVNARDDRGNLALHHAAMRGHAKIARMLIGAGSEIDAADKNGWTSLIAAAYFCQPGVVKELIDHNCLVNLQNKDMRTALHETCRSPSDDEQSLHDIAVILIEHGADVNSKSSDLGGADFTPLIFSAYHGHPFVAQALIDAACDINAQDSNLWTALHWACDRNQIDVVRVLLGAGIDVHITGKRGEFAVDRTQNLEIQHILSTVLKTELNNLDQSKLISENQQLLSINSSISSAAAEHSALIESQMLQSALSSHSSSSGSVCDSDSCGDTKDLNHVDLKANNQESCTNANTDYTEPEIVPNKMFDLEHEVDLNHVDLKASNQEDSTNANTDCEGPENVPNKPFDPEHKVDFIRNNDNVPVDKQ